MSPGLQDFLTISTGDLRLHVRASGNACICEVGTVHVELSPYIAAFELQALLAEHDVLSRLIDFLGWNGPTHPATAREWSRMICVEVEEARLSITKCFTPARGGLNGGGSQPAGKGPMVNEVPASGPPRNVSGVVPTRRTPSEIDVPTATYQLSFVDENALGIPGLTIRFEAPSGQQTVVSDDSGIARTEDVPGLATATIVNTESLDGVFAGLLDRQRRLQMFRKDDHPLCFTPRSLPAEFPLVSDKPVEVVVVLRTDTEFASQSAGWAPMSSQKQAVATFDATLGLKSLLKSVATMTDYSIDVSAVDSPIAEAPAALPRTERAVLGDAPFRQYVVSAGESIGDIAARVLGDPEDWMQLWTLNASALVDREIGTVLEGDRLNIPGTNVWPDWMQQPPIDWAPPESLADRTMTITANDVHQALFDEDFDHAATLLSGLLVAPLQQPSPNWSPALGESDLVFNTVAALTTEGILTQFITDDPAEDVDDDPTPDPVA